MLIVLPLVNAQVESLGTFKQNTCVNIVQTCANCTFTNISISDSDSTVLLSNTAMTQSGTRYTYQFCSTSTLGDYTVNGLSDVDGVNTVWAYGFLVTPSGDSTNLIWFIAIALAFAVGLMIFGFNKEDPWTVILGGFILVSLGLYILLNGIDLYRNSTTETIGLIVMLVGGYIGVRSALEVVTENL